MSDIRPSDILPTALKLGPVIVVGIVRDIEKSFHKDFQILSDAFNIFESITWHVVESGSNDASQVVLDNYVSNIESFSYQHLEHQTTLSRTENMAMARNAYLDYLRAESRLDKCEYVLMLDFNNLNNKLTADSVKTCFRNDSWDVVTANQSGRYYDIWALRHPLWSPNDCWEQHTFFRKYTKFPETAITFSMRSRMLRIPKNAEWIEVDSAFGGLAIYRASILRSSARYSGITAEGKRICEHVPFHSNLKGEGVRIFINPALINTRTTDHSRRLTAIFTLFRIFRYPFKRILKKSQYD